MAELKFIAISGTTGVAENCYLYEYGNDMILVDCGIGFPEPEMYGVDLVIPDFSYVLENRKKLRGIVISHGHEDHMGALPFLLKDLNSPIYATKLVAGFIKEKLIDYGIKNAGINIIDPERDSFSLGVFKITPFRVSHSVPDGVGYCISSPVGNVFHVADYKFDWTPVDKRPFDIAKAAKLASEGALALVSDSLGSTSEGYTKSESTIEEKIQRIAEKTKGRIFFTTISSNISRIQQALNVAHNLNRKAVFIGKSIDRKAKIASGLGYLKFYTGDIISHKDAAKYTPEKLMYFISGSYGQPGSALYRLAIGEHDYLKITSVDSVIFSADPAPPGSKANVDFVVDKLFERGANVHYYDIQGDLHVSGHGSIQDIQMLFALIKPKYFIPIGGTIRHNHAYSILAQEIGAHKSSIFELTAGEIVEFDKTNAKVAGKIAIKDVLVDGLGIGDVGNVVLRDRRTLAKDGIAIVLMRLDRIEHKMLSRPELISRGFVYESKTKDFMDKTGNDLGDYLVKKGKIDVHLAKDATIEFLERYFFDKTGRRPMILPLVIEV